MPKWPETCAKARSFFAFLARSGAIGLTQAKYLYITRFLVILAAMKITPDSAAIALAALGHPARLSVFRLLVRAAPDGLLVGEIAAHLDMPLSTLAHHLRSLKDAGLVTQTRQGREVRTSACTVELRNVLDFLLNDCCSGLPAVTDAA